MLPAMSCVACFAICCLGANRHLKKYRYLEEVDVLIVIFLYLYDDVSELNESKGEYYDSQPWVYLETFKPPDSNFRDELERRWVYVRTFLSTHFPLV